MPGETTFQKIKYALGIDEVKKFPVEVSEPAAKTIDKYLEEHTLTAKTYAGNATLKSGELAIQETGATIFTLPSAATANQLITCYCGLVSSVNVKAQVGQKIYGDFINGAGSITLMELQHVTVQSNGTAWDIIAGEPKREQAYTTKGYTKAEIEAGWVPSITRPTFVIVEVVSSLFLGGIQIGNASSAYVPPGMTVKVTTGAASQNVLTLLL